MKNHEKSQDKNRFIQLTDAMFVYVSKYPNKDVQLTYLYISHIYMDVSKRFNLILTERFGRQPTTDGDEKPRSME